MVFSIRCKGKLPIYANLGNGHVVVYVPEGRALYDVSNSRIKVVEWNQARMDHISPRREVIQKFLRGMFLSRFLRSWG